MDSSSAATASASVSSGSTAGLQEAMDQRRRRRMLSNRESARRSRQRKQRHLEGLEAQAAHLRRENAGALAALAATARGLLAVEAGNSVLRARAAELAARLRSLDDVLLLYTDQYCCSSERSLGDGNGGGTGGGIGEPWTNQAVVNVPLLATDMFQYC